MAFVSLFRNASVLKTTRFRLGLAAAMLSVVTSSSAYAGEHHGKESEVPTGKTKERELSVFRGCSSCSTRMFNKKITMIFITLPSEREQDGPA